MIGINENPSQETLNRWHNDPKNWICEIFYYNKIVKRLFVPTRTKFGLTINFANPMSVFVFVALIAVLVILSKMSA